jgi:hypothetical protein
MEEIPMKKIQLVCLLAVLAAVVSLSSPAQAQLYASPTGTGGLCSAGAPCTLTTAITIDHGVTVTCIEGGSAFLSSFSTDSSFEVNCPGGVVSGAGPAVMTLTGSSTQVVKLRGLVFAGASNSQTAPPFIKVTGGATLIIEDCKFEDEGIFSTGGTPIAIQFQPTSPAAQLIIRDTVFANNGFQAGGGGGGLQVSPAPGGSAGVLLERVSFKYNVTSMVLSGSVDAVMSNSTVSSSRSNGILVGAGAALYLKDSILVHNVGAAVSVASGGTLHLSNNDIRANQIGISNSGGQALSYKNNRIVANGSTATLGTITGGQ